MTEPKATSQQSLCVFCGSSSVVDKHYIDLARETGAAIGQSGYRLVYGGGGVGLMGACAKAAFEAGGDVLGIIPEFLQSREVLYEDVPHEVVPDMHTRKAKMYDAADAFIVLPGGIGTLEEAVEVISWLRMGLHAKPVIFLDRDDYYAPLLSLIRHTCEAKFTPDWLSDFLYEVDTPAQAIALARDNIGKREVPQLFHQPKTKDVGILPTA